jgi:hypothetical protein
VKVILLGPQRRPTLDAVAASLALDGPVATITAGWQERESADSELSELLDGRDVNLTLYQRWLDVQEHDPEFATAERLTRDVLDDVQEIYLLRLDHALRAVDEISRLGDNGSYRADELTEAIAAVRELDATHLRRVNGIRGEFYARLQPHRRPLIAEHRAEIERLLGEAVAVVIAGGHVGVLTDTLHLFNVAPFLRSTVIAWSAGAMALTDRILLFHDRAPQGPGRPEVYGAGLSVLRNLVALPHARARLLLDDVPRMALFARRLAPVLPVLLENGARVDTGTDGACPAGTVVLAVDGRVTALAAR